MILIILGIIILALIAYVISIYNKLVSTRNKVKDGWAQIDVQLKRRADLIPNLVETVKGYTKHESDTLENVIKARNSFNTAGSIDEEITANNQITGALNKLFALSESYPDLKANDNFLSLQKDLKDIEEKISYARQFYNDIVLTYNNLTEMFPSNIIANMFGFKKMAFFEITNEKEKETPQVKF